MLFRSCTPSRASSPPRRRGARTVTSARASRSAAEYPHRRSDEGSVAVRGPTDPHLGGLDGCVLRDCLTSCRLRTPVDIKDPRFVRAVETLYQRKPTAGQFSRPVCVLLRPRRRRSLGPARATLIRSCVTLYRYRIAHWAFQPAKPPILSPGAENNHARPYHTVVLAGAPPPIS